VRASGTSPTQVGLRLRCRDLGRQQVNMNIGLEPVGSQPGVGRFTSTDPRSERATPLPVVGWVERLCETQQIYANPG
jgi:hypothetical protein